MKSIDRLIFFYFLLILTSSLSILLITFLSGSISLYLNSLAISLASLFWCWTSFSLYSKMISSTGGSISSNYERVFVVNAILSFRRDSLCRLFRNFVRLLVMFSFDSKHSFCMVLRPLLMLSFNFVSSNWLFLNLERTLLTVITLFTCFWSADLDGFTSL